MDVKEKANLMRGELEMILITARALVDYRKRVGPLNFQLEKADDYIRSLSDSLDALEMLSNQKEAGERKSP